LAPVPRFLGRISYSLYLTHMIVMAAVIHAVAGALPLSACFAIILPLAVVVANLSQRYVEAPTQRFGKLLADRIDRAGTGRPRWGGAPAMSAQPRLGTELES
jgi:peptidoglycan/LPS O-acetylase OafA/YrhL